MRLRFQWAHGSRRAFLAASSLLLTVAAADAQPADGRVADITSAGKLRVGLHLPQFTKDPVTNELHGHGTGTVIVQIAQELADRIGVKLELVGHSTPSELVDCLKAMACHIGFLGFVPGRTADVGFAPPHILVPFTLMVPAGSSIRNVADMDKPGTRIAAVRNHASTLALGRVIKLAETITVTTPDQAFELLRTGQADAWASPRPPLLEYSLKLADSRVLSDRYGANIQAMAVPKHHTGRLSYIAQFIDEAKATGMIQRMIERAGERGIEVAPRNWDTLIGPAPTR